MSADLLNSPESEGARILEQAIYTASMMPFNSAAAVLAAKEVLPDLRLGGSCLDMVEKFTMGLDDNSEIQVLQEIHPRNIHFALSYGGHFFDPAWSQASIGNGADLSFLKMYEIESSHIDGVLWDVSYCYSNSYLGNKPSRHKLAHQATYKVFPGNLSDAKDYLSNSINSSMPPQNYFISYPADGGSTDIIIRYFPRWDDFRISLRNFEFEGFQDDPAALELRDEEIQGMYGFRLKDLRDYFRYTHSVVENSVRQ